MSPLDNPTERHELNVKTRPGDVVRRSAAITAFHTPFGRTHEIAKGKCLGILGWQQRWGSVVGRPDYALDGEGSQQSLAGRWRSQWRVEFKCQRQQRQPQNGCSQGEGRYTQRTRLQYVGIYKYAKWYVSETQTRKNYLMAETVPSDRKAPAVWGSRRGEQLGSWSNCLLIQFRLWTVVFEPEVSAVPLVSPDHYPNSIVAQS